MVDCKGLRILLAGPYPPPFGGIASHLTSLVPGLRARGAEDIAVVSFNVNDAVEARDGFTLYRFNPKRHVQRLMRPDGWGMALATVRALRPHKLDARKIVAEAVKAILIDEVAARHRSQVLSAYQSDTSLEVLPLNRVWNRKRAIVLTVFGEVYERVGGPFIRQHPGLFRDLLAAPFAVASSSCHCARSFAPIGVTRAIEPVYYGVDLAKTRDDALRAEFRNAHGIGPHDVVVLFMGRFSNDMGLDVLLDAVPRMSATARVHVVLAGAKGDQSDRAAAVAAAHPGRVTIMQNVPFAQQPAIYSGADLVVAPSFDQRACMGMTIKEAMVAGLPVVGGAGGGVPEAIVHGETGFLVPLGGAGSVDVDQFLEHVMRLVDEPETRQRLGRAGRKRAEEMFSSEKTSDRMAQIFMAARATVVRPH